MRYLVQGALSHMRYRNLYVLAYWSWVWNQVCGASGSKTISLSFPFPFFFHFLRLLLCASVAGRHTLQ
jgi:hypothetical protein